jgi:hypothetical protein
MSLDTLDSGARVTSAETSSRCSITDEHATDRRANPGVIAGENLRGPTMVGEAALCEMSRTSTGALTIGQRGSTKQRVSNTDANQAGGDIARARCHAPRASQRQWKWLRNRTNAGGADAVRVVDVTR